MIKVDLNWITEQVHGQLIGENLDVSGVTIDSRKVQSGDLFIAIRGPNFDGHDYVDQAIAAGAVAVISSRPLQCECAQIMVADTRYALGLLARGVKTKLKLKTVAITGSSGKTTVKEMVATILRQQGEVLSTQGNFNNDIGVPLTLLNLTEQHEYAVIELGANHRGEIAYTTGLVQPDVALINNVSPAHVEGFGDIWGVARAKTEIAKGLSEDGVIITNADSDFHDYWMREFAKRQHRVFSTEAANADVRAKDITSDEHGCVRFSLCAGGQSVAVQLPLPGRHNVSNALAAASLCIELGVSLKDIAQGLGALNAVPGRMNIKEPGAGLRIIDDTYNANVASAKAALDVLATFPGYRVMVLGDMGELGAHARAYHEEVGAHAVEVAIDNLFTLGVLSQSASQVFNGHGGQHFNNRSELLAALSAIMQNEKEELTILVKGSRSARMEQVVEALMQMAADDNQQGRAAC
ncbi:UDP-N-acetylmuramoyl-tripeptide--D-alanyl-D-alanine ligase [Aliidiomarina minuta]|uniref:UDP-N-acetylmuramoyl-tripeptide--D-alanyl-D-alanine ligase n=1 Tax=Aliidiomarina minuta TaxID=880057 RepID=A0A432W921_9GAMM|nr:UDP-N-acetylmuramoyl-tripeptide--D-alanyl-D-alanine ligase [Aliidiomarina minuta]RUO26624.1 UDP-N-acetylmuramoyl-tripeptide--D-alanyl-D-alanine ligase [Aliidiomarina minuta]